MTSTKTIKKGFTIIELLTVLSIIIILISILVPGMNRARIFAKKVTQKGQFNEIAKGLELFRNDHQETYPDSGATDTAATPVGYCGAMKLCEAMLGQDGMGFHPSSQFLADATTSGTDPLSTADIYPFDLCNKIDPGAYTDPLRVNLRERARYLESDNIRASRLQDMYTWDLSTSSANFYAPVVSFEDDASVYHNAVITDVYLRAVSRCRGDKLGMPVLYYKADPSKLVHDPCFFNTALPEYATTNPSIYNFDDNYGLTRLGCPWEAGPGVNAHPMFTDIKVFYKAITNKKVTATPRPHNEDGYILMSAGYDGLYGTKDDVFNFAD
jgi:prepilin-type N-terminal cleavage/methylation domain-containing protein